MAFSVKNGGLINTMSIFDRSPVLRTLRSGWKLLASLPQLPTLLRRMSVSGEIRKIFQHKLTIMVVPHNALSRFQFRFSFSFFIFLIGFSVGMFSWAVVAVTSN